MAAPVERMAATVERVAAAVERMAASDGHFGCTLCDPFFGEVGRIFLSETGPITTFFPKVKLFFRI